MVACVVRCKRTVRCVIIHRYMDLTYTPRRPHVQHALVLVLLDALPDDLPLARRGL